MPGPSLLLAPITLALGDVATWNAIMFAAPVLAAWTAFALCRHLCGAALPAFVGGYVFGFSPYVLSQMQGAPQLALVGLAAAARPPRDPPRRGLAVRPPLRRGRRRSSWRPSFSVSTEVLATTAFFGALTLAVAWLRLPERRAALRRTAGRLAIAGAAAAVVVSPLLYYLLFGHRTLPEHALEAFPADLLSLVVPGALLAASPERVGGSVPTWATDGAYLGVPLLVLVGLFAWRQRRSRAAQVLLAAFAAAAVFGLGRTLIVGGHDTNVPMPWTPFAEVPFLRYAIPLRFTLYAFLAAARHRGARAGPPSGRRDVGAGGGRGAVDRPRRGQPRLAHAAVRPAVLRLGARAGGARRARPRADDPGLGAQHALAVARRLRLRDGDGLHGRVPGQLQPLPDLQPDPGGRAHPGRGARHAAVAGPAAALRRGQGSHGDRRAGRLRREWAPLLGTLGARPVREDGVVVYRLRGAPSA